MKRNRPFLIAIAVAISSVSALPAHGQQGGGEARNGALRVYLECGTFSCDSRHFRTEITYVNWVRDVQDSQVHLIMTGQATGSGYEVLMDFIGREDLGGFDDELTYSYSNTDTDIVRLEGVTGVVAVGLARYALLHGQEGPFTVGIPDARELVPDLPPGLQGDVEDPWDYWVFNYWVFRIGADVDYEKEDLDNERQASANFSANRTTELWKISVSGRGSFSLREGQYSDGSTFEDQREEGSVDGRVFYSLSEDWSVGVEAGASTSTRNNQDLGGQVGGGVEYSFFPYEDWTRRRMTLQSLIHARYYDYEEITQFNKTTETVWEGSVRWGLGFRQPWGTANLNATAEAFLHDPAELYRLSLGGRISIRLMRGLEWNINGNVSKIRDQIYIPLEELSQEDILLGRRQLPTNSRFEISTGLSFTFGSIFNNVVNNRFGYTGGGRGRFF
jgi:hypothetical protein